MSSSPVSSMLVKSPNWLGDIVLALPAMAALKSSFPGWRMCLVGNETAGDILSLSGLGLDYVRFDRRGGGSRISSRGAGPASGGSWRAALRALRRTKWDVGITFAESFSAALLLRLAGSRKVVGYRTDGRRALLSTALPRSRLGMRPHLVREYMILAEAAGAEPGDEEPRIQVSRQVDSRGRALLAEAGVDKTRPLVGLCPGAAYGPSKRWPSENFVEVGRRLASRGFAVGVLGSPSEADLAQEVAAAVPGAVSLAGRTTTADLAGCLAACSVVVANDSGAAHLAAAVGTGVVAVFGSTDASWTRPLGPKVAVVRMDDVPCAPCFGKDCDRGYACLAGITEKNVLDGVYAVLE